MSFRMQPCSWNAGNAFTLTPQSDWTLHLLLILHVIQRRHRSTGSEDTHRERERISKHSTVMKPSLFICVFVNNEPQLDVVLCAYSKRATFLLRLPGGLTDLTIQALHKAEENYNANRNLPERLNSSGFDRDLF